MQIKWNHNHTVISISASSIIIIIIIIQFKQNKFISYHLIYSLDFRLKKKERERENKNYTSNASKITTRMESIVKSENSDWMDE